MKKKIVLLGAVAAASLATVSLASCKTESGDTPTTSESTTKAEAKQTGISVSGYNSSLILGGDIKTTYANAKVVANYSDGSTKDITDSVEFDTSKVDTSKVGPYPVYIRQGSYLTMYLVTVVDYSLDSIEVDTTNFDTTLPVYSTLDFSSVVVKAKYLNPADKTTRVDTLDLSSVTFTVTDSSNQVVTELASAGTYTVTVAFGGKTATFDITCANPEVASSVKDAVEQGVKSDSTVNAGSYSHAASDYTIKKDYQIGTNFTKQVDETLYSGYGYGATTTYFSVGPNGEGFAVSVDSDGYVSQFYGDHKANALDASGVGFDIFSDGGTVYPQYGFAEVIKALYDRYESTYSDDDHVTKHESVAEADGVKTYKFDFNDITNSSSAAHFTHYSVSFTLNEQGAVSSATVITEQYSMEEDYVKYDDIKKAEYTLPAELGLTLVKGDAVGGGEVYSFTINDGTKAASTDTYTVSQASGAKLAASENPYSVDKVAISSFNVSKLNDEGNYEEMVEGGTYTDDLDYATVSKDDGSHSFAFTIKVDGIAPETANSDLDSIKVVIKGTAQDGKWVDSSDLDISSYSYAYAANNGDGTYTLRFGRAGVYTVTVSSAFVTKTYTFDIKDEAPTVITPLLQDGEVTSDFNAVSTFECYTTNNLYLDCSVASYFTQGYTLAVVEVVNGEDVATEKAAVVKGTYEINGKSVSCYKFSATEAGTYKLVFTGATPDNPAKSAAQASIVVTVKDVPSVDEIVKGANNYLFEATVSASEMYKVQFGAPSEDNGGTITIWNKYDKSKQQVGTYTYVNGVFVIDVESTTIDLADKATFDIAVDSYYGLSLKNSFTHVTYKLNAPTSDITDSELALLDGKYEATSGSKTIAVKFTPSTTVKGDGSVEVTVTEGESNTTNIYDYTFNCDTKALDLSAAEGVTPFAGTIKVSSDKLVYVEADSTTEVEFVEKKINIAEICSGKYTASFDNSGNGNTDYVVEFNEDGTVTLTNKGKSRTRVCSYTLNEETGKFTFTKISGSSSSTGLENYLYIVDGQIKYTGMTVGGNPVFTKEGGSTVVTIPTSAQGTWYGTDSESGFDYTVTIDSTKVVVESEDDGPYTYTVKSVSGNVVTLADSIGELTLTISSNSIAYDDGSITMTLSKTRTYKTPAGYDGTWSYKDDYTDIAVELTEGSTTVKVTQYEDTVSYTITNVSGSVITIYDDWNDVYYTVTLGNDSVAIEMYGNSYTLTKDDSTTVTIEFSEEFIGTWSTSDSKYYLTISTDSISFKGNEGTITGYTEDDNVYEINIYGDEYYVGYADGHVTLQSTGSDRTTYTLYNIPTGVFYVNKEGEASPIYVGSTTVSVDDYDYTISSITASESGEVTIIATDSKDPTCQVKLVVVDGAVTSYAETFNSGEDWNEYTVVTGGEAATFSSDYIGTWATADESSTIVITESTVTYNGTEVAVTGSADEGYEFTTTNAAGHEVTALFYLDSNGVLNLGINGNWTEYAKKNTTLA